MDEFQQISPSGNNHDDSFPSLSRLTKANGQSVVDLLGYHHNRNSIQLSKILGRSIREINEYQRILKEGLGSAHRRNLVREFLETKEFVHTGLSTVDRALGGGVPLGEITELFGASGTGKSHFLLQLCLQCQLKSKESIYIATESYLETKRLSDIQNTLTAKGGKVLTDAISYIFCKDLESQDHILFTQVPALLQKKDNIGLIVIDSIAHHLRRQDGIVNSEYLSEKIQQQENFLEKCSEYHAIKLRHQRQLKKFGKSSHYRNKSTKALYLYLMHRHLVRIARENNVAIVVVNQVSDFTSDIEHESDPLNLDFQTGVHSGWDMRTIYEHFPSRLGDHSVVLNTSESEIMQSSLINKRVKLGMMDFSSVRAAEGNELLMKLWDQTKATRKYVPTLGYQWSKRIRNRIMLMKFYKPLFYYLPERVDLSGLASAQSSRGYESSVSNFSDVQRRTKRTQTNLPIEGWNVERYIKVISALHNPSSVDSRISFVIDAEGIREGA